MPGKVSFPLLPGIHTKNEMQSIPREQNCFLGKSPRTQLFRFVPSCFPQRSKGLKPFSLTICPFPHCSPQEPSDSAGAERLLQSERADVSYFPPGGNRKTLIKGRRAVEGAENGQCQDSSPPDWGPALPALPVPVLGPRTGRLHVKPVM